MSKGCWSALGQFLLLVLFATAAAQNAATPPPGQPPARSVDSAEGLHVDPKKGQGPEQVLNDRYECHDWARSQSGFDPIQPAAGMTAEETASRRDEYQRAVTACLEARGYSAHYAAPAAAAGAAAATAPAARHAALHYHPWTVHVSAGYALVQGTLKPDFRDGGTVGLGFAWSPSSSLPLKLRLDVSGSRFDATLHALEAASIAYSTNVAYGHQNVYGGDADVQLDLAHGPRGKAYFFGGFGRYRQQTVFEQVSPVYGWVCYFGWCTPGYFGVVSTVERKTSEWLRSWNAGFGIEFALQDPASFFIEARYVRIAPYNTNQGFVPIVIGLRF
jgi:hypothetical protein